MRRKILIGLTVAVTALVAGISMAPARNVERGAAPVKAGIARGSVSEGARPVPDASLSPEEASAIAALVGTTPPEWQVERWLNSPPLRLAELRGKPVLVRWWTAGCPYCATTAPALREIEHAYGSRGLVVIGMYHHKEAGPFDPAVYEETAKKYGFTFPLAFDPEWRTFKSWMHGADSGWTSVTFLLDKKGVVRWFHPGGKYEKGDASYAQLTQTIDKLLAER